MRSEEYRHDIFCQLQAEKVGGGDWMCGSFVLGADSQARESDRRTRKRIGARLFELADEHLPKKQASLLRRWAGGASQKQLNWWYRRLIVYGGDITKTLNDVLCRLRRLADDDLECQLLLASLGWRTV